MSQMIGLRAKKPPPAPITSDQIAAWLMLSGLFIGLIAGCICCLK